MPFNIQKILVQIGVSLASIFIINQLASQGGIFTTIFRGPNGTNGANGGNGMSGPQVA